MPLIPVQNKNISAGIREATQSEPEPTEILADASVIRPVYNVGQGGFASLRGYYFKSAALSVNGVAASYTVGVTAPAYEFGESVVDNVFKLMNLTIKTSGGTASPLFVEVRVVDASANVYVLWADSLANPSSINIPAPLFKMDEFSLELSCGAGGAGDTVTFEGFGFVGVPGEQLP